MYGLVMAFDVIFLDDDVRRPDAINFRQVPIKVFDNADKVSAVVIVQIINRISNANAFRSFALLMPINHGGLGSNRLLVQKCPL